MQFKGKRLPEEIKNGKNYILGYEKLSKNEILFHHITVGGDTNRGTPPRPVSHRPLLAVIGNL